MESIIPVILGGDGIAHEKSNNIIPKILDGLERTDDAISALLDMKVLRALDFQDNPSMRSAIQYMEAQGGKIVETIGSPLVDVIFRVEGKGFFIYSELSKKFFNTDGSGKPKALASYHVISEENRIGVYMSPEHTTGKSIYFLVDFALNKSPIVNTEGEEFPYCICDENGKLIGYSTGYKKHA